MKRSGNSDNMGRGKDNYISVTFQLRGDFESPKIKGHEALIIKEPTMLRNLARCESQNELRGAALRYPSA